MREPFLTYIVRSFNINKKLLHSYAKTYLAQITPEEEHKFKFKELCKQILIKKEYTYSDFMNTRIYPYFNYVKIMSNNKGEIFKRDYVCSNIFALQKWVEQPQDTRRYYRIGKNFGEELLSSDISISSKAILKFSGCEPVFFEFHKPLAEPDGRLMYAAIMYIDESGVEDGTWVAVIHGIGLNSQRGLSTTYCSFIVDQDKVHARYDGYTTEEQKQRVDALIKYSMRCFLYIHSGNPDLRELKPETMTKNQKKVIEGDLGIDLRCAQTLVSWGWKKPIEYGVDSTHVSGHFRWQPCGAGRTNVQLTWVREHERYYGKGDTQ